MPVRATTPPLRSFDSTPTIVYHPVTPPADQFRFEGIISQNIQMKTLWKDLKLVSPTDSNVLIFGETGTGKEVVARAIHKLSCRNHKPLVSLNCAALPFNLIESTLFGHERGAFTGAVDRRIGKFELAHGATLFLDEIGELPLDTQAKLLRALQEKEIERVGSNKIIRADARIIAATNRDLSAEVKAGRFRSDLYYRLNVFPLTLPPLRDRPDDIILLASHFIIRLADRLGKKIDTMTEDVCSALLQYDWPGNVRELEHIVERMVILCSNGSIQDLPFFNTPRTAASEIPASYEIKTLQQNQRDYIMYVLDQCNGKVSGPGSASEVLQLPGSTLRSKMHKLGIRGQYLV